MQGHGGRGSKGAQVGYKGIIAGVPRGAGRVQRYCSWDSGTPRLELWAVQGPARRAAGLRWAGGYGVKQRAGRAPWLGLQQLRYWGAGVAWAEGHRGAG